MKFEIRPRQTENGIVTDIYMDERYISEDVIAMKIAANQDETLHIQLTFVGEIDFCCDDLTVVSKTDLGQYSQYIYMSKENKQQRRTVWMHFKKLWQKLRYKSKSQ